MNMIAIDIAILNIYRLISLSQFFCSQFKYNLIAIIQVISSGNLASLGRYNNFLTKKLTMKLTYILEILEGVENLI